ncbi:hypothetical protein BLL69_0878c [Lacticaseibacillus paracasei]|nr:hypothetical protein BLL69_0878c [Lacticaseibacillus paracasei]
MTIGLDQGRHPVYFGQSQSVIGLAFLLHTSQRSYAAK